MPLDLLVVDDDPDTSEVFRELLAALGYSVRACTTGASALEICKHSKIDVVLMDISMPDMDGIVACKHLKQAHPELSVVFVTGHRADRVKAAATQAGAAMVLEKPTSVEQLRAALEAIAGARESAAALRSVSPRRTA